MGTGVGGDATQSGVAGVKRRRGLPRVPGGEPWPPAFVAAVSTGAAVRTIPAPVPAPVPPTVPDAAPEAPVPPVDGTRDAAFTGSGPQQESLDADARPLRRGLPRVAGGEPWPPAGRMRPAAAVAPAANAGPGPEPGAVTKPGSAANAGAVPGSESAAAGRLAASAAGSAPTSRVQETPPARKSGAEPHPESLEPGSADVERMRDPLPFTPTVFPGRAAFERPAPRPEPRRYGPFTALQWVGASIVAGVGALFALAMVVFATRWLVSLEPLRDFLATYPGEYHLPESAPVGLPAWLGWQHFLNAFFMLLIIRSGLQVRREKRPSAFWTPRWNSKRKTSLTIWFHQSLDLLWLVNGLVFLVLLFVTGQWMRIVPTSWEVLPNALSAMLQYASLDWPSENGWVNYNSLQQLAYFTTVFVAAPLAILTGVRMSGLWPRKAETLNRAYPIEWARRVHFPVMLFFVAFIIVHVALVFATGALRNLNHMYAAQGSTDPTAYADNWVGFWIFAASVLVMAGGWIAARPLVLAPIARLFGTVSAR